MRIEDFVKIVTESRKRTGIVLLNPDRSDFLSDFEKVGVKVIDLTNVISGRIIISDNKFLDVITDTAIIQPTCFINIELVIGPRFEEAHYLNILLPKLIAKEPLKPVFLVFYSKLLYEKFKTFYLNSLQTSNHFFEEDY